MIFGDVPLQFNVAQELIQFLSIIAKLIIKMENKVK